MKTIIHIDPAIGSTNLGDEIISDAVSFQLRKLFENHRIICISSRDIGTWSKKSVLSNADFIFFGGSNALSSNPVFGYRQFAMGIIPPYYLEKIILLGVGWWQYQDNIGFLGKSLYKKILRGNIIHSVRDVYSKRKMYDLGFKSTLNTSCPTMWDLESFECQIPNKVIITLTDYNKNHERDINFIKAISKKFNHVSFWPQGTDDLNYFQTISSHLDTTKIKLINPSIHAFNESLKDKSCYIGTRLHAGIRALQYQCPTYIIPIDNRATEISKTESLPLISSDLLALEIGQTYRYNHIKNLDIEKFTNQFL
jgi:polysaccharide pyruvyl transferase WcaK-like protein